MAATLKLQGITFNLLPVVRNEILEGKKYLVAPMVMLVEGVHEGSDGPFLYPAEELSKTPMAWDHKPVVVYHPQLNGQAISACDPIVLEKQKVGLILNTRWDDKSAKLRSEAWLDDEKIDTVDERIRKAVNDVTVMELSTGVFVDAEIKEGEWKGSKYAAIARNYRADHLALLPDRIGACSVAKGAGLLQTNEMKLPWSQQVQLDSFFRGAMPGIILTTNAMSFQQINSALQAALAAKMGKPGQYWDGYICDVYPSYVIFREYDDNCMYSIGYSMSKDGVTLTGDPVEVQRTIQYQTTDGKVVGNQLTTNSGGSTMARTAEEKKVAIDGLIKNGAWTEGDRKFLEGSSEEQLTRMVTLDKVEQDAKKAATQNQQPPVVTPPVVTQPVLTTNTQQVPTPAPFDYEAWKKTAPVAVQNMLDNGIAAYQQEMTFLVENIKANPKNVIPEAQLKGMDINTLRGMFSLIRPEAPVGNQGQAGGVVLPSVLPMQPLYTLNGGQPPRLVDNEEPLDMPSSEEKKAAS